MLSDFIKKENIIINLKSKTKEKVFEEILSHTKFSKEKRKIIFHSLMQRELLGTTGIGNGVAIPHARSLILDKLQLFIGISKKGIKFESMDGKPVYIVFLIIAPPLDKANQYLILLGRIAEISRNMSINKECKKIKTKEQLIELINEYDKHLED